MEPFVQIMGLALVVAAGLLALRGWLRSRRRAGAWRERVQREDLLKHVGRADLAGRQVTVESIAGALGIDRDAAARLLDRLASDGLVRLTQGEIHLSPDGRTSALHIIRAHRLWERHLAESSGYPETEWHRLAEAREHELTPEAAEALSARLGHPTHDPHGDPIPTATGEVKGPRGRPLTSFEAGTALRIVHVEDEPEAVYAQLVAEGLAAGMETQLVEIGPERIKLWTEVGEHVLAPVVAANLHVLPSPKPPAALRPAARLCDLELGQAAEVSGVARQCRGAERRRLMDLGILPGTRITPELVSPGGDPTAYRLRSSLIALRREQAANIFVHALEAEEASDVAV